MITSSTETQHLVPVSFLKIMSINLWKLVALSEIPYGPDGTIKAVFSLSSSLMFICQYLEKQSRTDKYLLPTRVDVISSNLYHRSQCPKVNAKSIFWLSVQTLFGTKITNVWTKANCSCLLRPFPTCSAPVLWQTLYMRKDRGLVLILVLCERFE